MRYALLCKRPASINNDNIDPREHRLYCVEGPPRQDPNPLAALQSAHTGSFAPDRQLVKRRQLGKYSGAQQYRFLPAFLKL